GSRIVATSVSLSAGGDIDNRGSTVTAQDALAVASGGNLTNSEGGLLNAGGGLNLVALGNLTNSSATIQGNTVTLASVGGDIVNTTTTKNWDSISEDTEQGRGSYSFSSLGKVGGINAGSLILSAGQNIRNEAAQIEVQGDITLQAANNILLSNILLREARVDSGPYGGSAKMTSASASRINANGALTLQAGHDIALNGAQLSAGGPLQLAAGNDIRLTALSTVTDTVRQDGGAT
ncbi:hemagglutinin repeat-containing protein, partial [Dickeya dadantii]